MEKEVSEGIHWEEEFQEPKHLNGVELAEVSVSWIDLIYSGLAAGEKTADECSDASSAEEATSLGGNANGNNLVFATEDW